MNNAPEPGIYPSVPMHSYLGWDAVSSHDCKLMLRSPEHYAHAKAKDVIRSQAMNFGTACHTWVLEGPEAAAATIAVKPDDIDRRTKVGKERFAEFEKSAGGKTIISGSDARHIARIKGNISNHELASEYLDLCDKREWSCLAKHNTTGLALRGRPDAFCQELVIDLKTTQDASPDAFSKSIQAFGYHIQAFAYLFMLRQLGAIVSTARFAFIAVEKLPPYQVEVYELDAEDIIRGGELYTYALQLISECKTHNRFTSDTTTRKTIGLPRYARQAHDSRYLTD